MTTTTPKTKWILSSERGLIKRENEESETQHTKGPWHVGIKQAEQIVYDAKGNAVANASTYYFDSTKELCHANARLIAASPELLEALKTLLALQGNRENGNMPKLSDWTNGHHNARLAISKATGIEL